MKKGILFVITLVALGLAWASQANAQEEHYGARPWELNVNAGAHFVDVSEEFSSESDTDVGVGARVFMNRPSGIGFGGNFTYVISNADFGGEDRDVNAYLYSGELAYTFAASTRLHPFVNIGVGGATIKVSDVPDEFEDSVTNLLIPVGGGIKYFGSSGSWAIRVDARDNIVMCSAPDDPLTELSICPFDDETFHNIEVSGGVSFLFGGGM